MQYSLEQGVVPAEPITLEEAKHHLRVSGSDDDDLISGLIAGAREWAENYCRRSFVERALTLRMDCFPEGEIRLPRGPVVAVSSIAVEGVAVSTDVYEVDLYSTPARIVPAFGQVWPVISSPQANAVVIAYTAGYAVGSPADYAQNVPHAIKSALKLLVEMYYDRQFDVSTAAAINPLEKSIKALLAPFEIRDYTLE